MRPLSILILSDGRPGHYHLAEGVAAAVRRRRTVDIEKLAIARRKALPTRLLATGLSTGALSPTAALKAGYGLSLENLPKPDLVISAGGDTLIANAAIAAATAARNIYCGTLRHLAPEHFSLIVSSYERHAQLPRHVVCLKPSAMDPDTLERPRTPERYGGVRPPARAALLIGGDSGLFRYDAGEWRRLIDFLPALHAAWGTRWLVSTSRRTDEWVADAVAELAAKSPSIEQLIDFRTAGPGTLPGILARADVALCTEDSSTMISEAVAARLAVVGVAPKRHAFKPEEADYRAMMLAKGWCRFLPLAELSPDRLAAALSEVTPMPGNHLDMLAATIAERLPELFAEAA
jgi:hypothetical protein